MWGRKHEIPHRDAKLHYGIKEREGLFTRMKKSVPLLICVQSKNNLPSPSTAHWGKLVKESVSKEREYQCAADDQTRTGERGDKRGRV